MRFVLLAAFAAVLLTACSGSPGTNPVPSSSSTILHQRDQATSTTSQTYFVGAVVQNVVTDGSGNGVYALVGTNANPVPSTWAIGHVTNAGAIQQYSLPSDASGDWNYTGISLGPDGNLWVAGTHANAAFIDDVTPAGMVSVKHTFASGTQSGGLVLGADQRAWVELMNSSGTYLTCVLASGAACDYDPHLSSTQLSPYLELAATQGGVWTPVFSNFGSQMIRVAANGSRSVIALPAEYHIQRGGGSIALGADNALWFTAGSDTNAGLVGRMTLGYYFSFFNIAPGGTTLAVSSGLDHNIWVAYQTSDFNEHLGRLTSSGSLSYQQTLANSPASLTTSSGYVWAGEYGGLEQVKMP